MLHDDEGDSITEKKPNVLWDDYAVLGMENITNARYVGFGHYRRSPC